MGYLDFCHFDGEKKNLKLLLSFPSVTCLDFLSALGVDPLFCFCSQHLSLFPSNTSHCRISLWWEETLSPKASVSGQEMCSQTYSIKFCLWAWFLCFGPKCHISQRLKTWLPSVSWSLWVLTYTDAKTYSPITQRPALPSSPPHPQPYTQPWVAFLWRSGEPRLLDANGENYLQEKNLFALPL